MILLPATVAAQHLDSFVHPLVARDDHPAIAAAAEVLGGEEAEAAGDPKGSHPSAPVCRSDRLGTIFDDGNRVFVGDSHDGVHVARLAI